MKRVGVPATMAQEKADLKQGEPLKLGQDFKELKRGLKRAKDPKKHGY